LQRGSAGINAQENQKKKRRVLNAFCVKKYFSLAFLNGFAHFNCPLRSRDGVDKNKRLAKDGKPAMDDPLLGR
jgi:hypothetical protein